MKQGGTNCILKSITRVPKAALLMSMLMASRVGCFGSARSVGEISKNPTFSLYLQVAVMPSTRQPIPSSVHVTAATAPAHHLWVEASCCDEVACSLLQQLRQGAYKGELSSICPSCGDIGRCQIWPRMQCTGILMHHLAIVEF